jgi:pimeloyl-ACP methyl ester carboxylesterase
MTLAQEEARELSRIAGEELSSLPRGIGDLHDAISGRVFRALGPAAAPVRVIHDAIVPGTYGAVSGGLWLTGAAAGTAIRLDPETPRGAAVLAALNGLLGDRLAAEGSELAIPMQVRTVGGEPGPDIAVFVHGLGETEFAWGSPSYGERLQGWTPVFIRFNTGRHISENGASLSELLDELVAAWPGEVRRVALIGHSMGGLVARSACHHGGGWTRHVTHTVSLGTPHMGAPLEQAVHALSAALHVAPETRPFARFLRRRSAGIRDLRRGSLVDDDWRDLDPDALRSKALSEIPLLDGASHYFVAATVTRSPDHPVGRLLGDTLVLSPSASGLSRRRKIGFDEELGFALGGAHHLALLNHPEVYARLREWLA